MTVELKVIVWLVDKLLSITFDDWKVLETQYIAHFPNCATSAKRLRTKFYQIEKEGRQTGNNFLPSIVKCVHKI